jgi:non-specific serine/threonine protein kinase/serine/threonine-protein kinase
MSTAARFRRVEETFRAASQLEPDRREQFLAGCCGDDEALRAEVMALLDADAMPDGVLDRPALGAGMSVATLQSAGGEIPGPLPHSIGRYRILRIIGVGGMGVVYEAEQDNPRRTVALKVINSALASRSMLRRFEHEAQVLGRLQHPGIAQIFEAGTFNTGAGDQPYFAMELVRGSPLNEYIRGAQPDLRVRLELIARIADAVEHAHQRGVIHRDLKPSNILVGEHDASSHSGSGSSLFSGDALPMPRILDFGVARLSDHDVQSATLRTEVGQLIGTIRYMSPEQAAGDPNEIDTRSDVYSIGVIAYEVLTGRLPYPVQDKLVHEAVRIIREDEPTPLSAVDRSLRGDVATIIA